MSMHKQQTLGLTQLDSRVWKECEVSGNNVTVSETRGTVPPNHPILQTLGSLHMAAAAASQQLPQQSQWQPLEQQWRPQQQWQQQATPRQLLTTPRTVQQEQQPQQPWSQWHQPPQHQVTTYTSPMSSPYPTNYYPQPPSQWNRRLDVVAGDQRHVTAHSTYFNYGVDGTKAYRAAEDVARARFVGSTTVSPHAVPTTVDPLVVTRRKENKRSCCAC